MHSADKLAAAPANTSPPPAGFGTYGTAFWHLYSDATAFGDPTAVGDPYAVFFPSDAAAMAAIWRHAAALENMSRAVVPPAVAAQQGGAVLGEACRGAPSAAPGGRGGGR